MEDEGSVKAASRPAGLVVSLRRNRAKAIALAAITVVIVWFLWPEDEKPPPPPLTAPVMRGDIEHVIAASGVLEASSLVDVGAQVSGQLRKLHVQLGDVISQGDLLAEIDDFIQQTRVSAARANLESLEAASASQKASLELSRSDLQRQERLMKARATTEVEYDRAVVSLSQAEANLARHFLQIEQARASLEEAKALLDFTRIMAPAGGTVVRIHAQKGQTLIATQTAPTILQIGDLRTITVSARVSEADLRRLTPGMEAYFTTPADGERRWRGSLKEISPMPERSSGLAQFVALAEVSNADGALLPGMSAKVFFVAAAARGVLKIPLGAVTFMDGAAPTSASAQYAASSDVQNGAGARGAGGSGTTGGRTAVARIVNSSGEQETRQVRIGVSNDVEAEVLSGLSEGERAVIGTPQPPMPQSPFFVPANGT